MSRYTQTPSPLRGLQSRIYSWVANTLGATTSNQKFSNDQRPSQRLNRVYTYQVAMRMDILKQAIRAAKDPLNPDRTRLVSMYDQAVKNDRVEAVIRNRNSIITGQPFFLCRKDSKEIDLETTKLLQRPWFTDFMELAAEAPLFGHSLIEFGELLPGQDIPLEFREVCLIPREFVIPEKRILRFNIGDVTGKRYDEPPFSDWLLEVGKRTNLGLLQAATRLVIFLEFAETDWASRSERFGMPIISVKTSSTRKEDIDIKEQMAANIGRNGYVIMDIGDEIELIESKGTSGNPAEIYARRIEMAYESIAILILGQSMTTGDGSSQSQAEVHERVLYELIEADMRSLQAYFNFNLLPFLVSKGYPVANHEFVFKRFYKQYKDPASFPEPQSQGEPGASIEPGPGGAKPSGKSKPVVEEEDDNELGFNKPLHPNLGWGGDIQHSVACGHNTLALAPSPYQDKIKKGWATLVKRTFADAPDKEPKATPEPDPEVTQTFHQATYDALYNDFKTNYADGFAAQAPLQPQVIAQANLIRFSGAKSLAAQDQLRAALYDANGKVTPWLDFRKQAIALNKDYNLNYLAAERQACISSGIMSAQWQRLQSAKKAYPYLRYKAVMDARTRPEHASLNGLVRHIDDPCWLSIYPPKAFGCRCGVEPLMQGKESSDKVVNNAIAAAKIPPVFKLNTMGQVFGNENGYASPLQDKALKANTAWLLQKEGYKITKGTNGNFAAIHPQVLEQAKKGKAEAKKWDRESDVINAITKTVGRSVIALPESEGKVSNGIKNPDLLMLDTFTKAEIKSLVDATDPSRAVKQHLREARKQGTSDVFVALRNESDLQDAQTGYYRYTGAPENKLNMFRDGKCVFLVDGKVVWQSK